jgi:hypothetical protein
MAGVRPLRHLVVIAVVALVALWPREDEVPPAGAAVLVPAERQWPDALRRALDLEPVNPENLDEPCGRYEGLTDQIEGVQDRALDSFITEAMHGVLGRDWATRGSTGAIEGG